MCRTDNKKMAYKDSGGSRGAGGPGIPSFVDQIKVRRAENDPPPPLPPPLISGSECLRFANQAMGDCWVPIQPYHVSSPNVPWDQILFVFGGSIIRRPPPPPPDPDEWLEYFGITLEPDDDPFLRYVLPPAPPGWAEYMSQF